jgi:hypothetical protein
MFELKYLETTTKNVIVLNKFIGKHYNGTPFALITF